MIIEQNDIKKIIDKIDNILAGERLEREDDVNVNNLEHHVLDFIRKNKDYPEIKQMRRKFGDKIEAIHDSSDDNRSIMEYVKYILEGCKFCLLSISSENKGEAEDYAIDIFNTLNATGEPLTAFEVFKSTVHKELKKKVSDNSIDKLNDIEKCLIDGKWKKKKQNKYTDRLLLFLSMIDKDLRRFKKLTTFRDKKEMLDHMTKELKPKFGVFVNDISKLHKFIFFNWERDKREMFIESEEEGVCFDFLRSISHDRVLPVLFNFSFPSVSDKERGKALKACIAFTCLWRGVTPNGGTDGIDDQYRFVTEDIFGNQNVDKLRDAFQKQLINRWLDKKRDKVITVMNKENWVKKFTEADLYKATKMARFMLFVAFHRRVFNSDSGLLVKSPLEFITKSNYSNKGDYRTVEHIVPQNHRDVGKIGNLTLLPQRINSSVGAGDFRSKAEVYKQCIEDTRNEGNDLPYVRILRELLYFDNKKYLDNEGYLNDVAIKERGERLGHAVWETLAEDWLGWTGG